MTQLALRNLRCLGRVGDAPPNPEMSRRNNFPNSNNNNHNNNMGDNFGRDTGHESDQFWTSCGRRVWDSVMQASGMTFNNLGWSDLEADNSLLVMSTFVQSCKNNPPMRVDESGPHDSETVKKAFSTGIVQIKRKFANQIRTNPNGECFPAEVVTECRRAMGQNHGRNMMEGPDESELCKSMHPFPRKHNNSTLLL